MSEPDKKEKLPKPKTHTSAPVDVKANNSIRHTNDNGQSNNQSKTSVYKRVIIFFGNNENQSKVANLVSFGMLVITAILAYYTYGVFHQTSKQTQAATDAAKAASISATVAQQTLKADTIYNNKMLKNQNAQSDSTDSSNKRSDIRQKLQFEFQQKTFVQQIEALNETQKEFEIENRPFLEIVSVIADTTTTKDKIHVGFIVINLGKQPCKINNASFFYGIATKEFEYDKTKLIHNKELDGNYIGNNAYRPLAYDSKDDTTSSRIATEVKKGNGFAFVMGNITYQSIIGNKKHDLSFYYRIKLKPLYNVSTVKEDYK